MPGTTTSPGRPPAEDSTGTPSEIKPDRVGEELADDARIWRIFGDIAKQHDDGMVQAWNNGFENLALFATLFSAVTTAFLLEARKDMTPDYAELSFLVLNATNYGTRFVHEPFVVPTAARTVNGLWTASLILSLLAALISVMGKEWLTMYTSRDPDCNPRQWAEIRSYRLLCIRRWYMRQIVDSAQPLLLHASFILFLAGLVLFISPDPFMHHLTLGMCVFAGVIYSATTIGAIIFSGSPFKSPATQMIRAAISAIYSYAYSIIYRPKRHAFRTLVYEIHAMVLGQADGTAFLPGGPAERRPRYAGLRSSIALARASATSCMQTGLWTVCHKFQWSCVRQQLHSIVSAVHHLPTDWFLSSTWTYLPVDRRPELLAEALSWLSVASQAPDVFRAVVYALGDLDVGPQVGKHTSLALRTRLRAEIRRTWLQVDFLTLSRYVLADRNTPGNPVLLWAQFTGRFDLSKDSALRCEDGLAAVIRVDPGNILPSDLVKYSPDQVAQPRMHEFLLPHMQKPQKHLTDVLILLSNRYRDHLWMTDSFSLDNLEANLYETLDTETRDKYATIVTVKYGGIAGAIEILTFLCCHGVIDGDTRPAAVELIMELLRREYPVREHRCLAYVFGTTKLWHATWKDKRWSPWSLYCLSRSLEVSRLHPFEPTSVRTLSDDRQFDLALERTAVMILSPQYRATLSAQQPYPLRLIEREGQWIEFLHRHLCQSPSPSCPDKDEQYDVISLILDSATLLRIVGSPDYFGYRGRIFSCGTVILAMIISHLGRRLQDPTTIHDGEQLFAALAHTEVKGPDGETHIWDLGEWLRTHAPEIVKRCPSTASKMQDVYDALSTIYPLCKHNPELQASWDLIGYSGPPEDIVYLCDPYLDLGNLFARSEDPVSQLGV